MQEDYFWYLQTDWCVMTRTVLVLGLVVYFFKCEHLPPPAPPLVTHTYIYTYMHMSRYGSFRTLHEPVSLSLRLSLHCVSYGMELTFWEIFCFWIYFFRIWILCALGARRWGRGDWFLSSRHAPYWLRLRSRCVALRSALSCIWAG